ncbi:MAG: hypothetical protein NTW67_03120 [Candidatus Woesearchaeota archaeon]|nr:hypothetical protein [Candidatus Woesearchaeota archaeon]
MKYIPIIVAILLILAACAQEEKKDIKANETAEQLKAAEPAAAEQKNATEPAKEANETEQPKTEQQEIETEQPEAKEEVKEETTSPAQTRTRMYRFLDKFAKVTGYDFIYKGDHYYTKGTKYKIILSAPQTVSKAKFGDVEKNLYYYDTIYVDKTAKTAIAYCEGHTAQLNKQCAQLELYDLAYPAPYDDYSILLPEDWLLTYLDREPSLLEENKYYIEGRATVFVRFNETPEIELSIDPGNGLVLRADEKKGNQLLARYSYEQVTTDKVRDVDIMHRSKSEIPSDETFYR